MNKKSGGFTLIEVLVSFSVVLVLTAFFPILLKSIYTLTKENKEIHPLELEVFIHQAKMEIRNAKHVTTNGKMLTIMNRNNQTITYENYEGKVRRRVNGSGHEILLQNVHQVTYVEQNNGAVFLIEGNNHEFYEITVSAIVKEWTSD
ncbi:competence type IV pilus minor pilin ComGF [Sutcliffiella halmapala]|uniref:competence type IV pilus minor pilin ComGF n=1 Tax=Sutcliffiella halmapala TaxID=79882 RepID=UPI0009957945|nr:competence type IV pilus minor pilin ComGF [Sutcliffiella halmapala]